MGGHKAWRKRVERGELAKGMGGAICRHRPRLGPKGKEAIARQRRGYSNPKRRKRNAGNDKDEMVDEASDQQNYIRTTHDGNKRRFFSRSYLARRCSSVYAVAIALIFALTLFGKGIMVLLTNTTMLPPSLSTKSLGV